ncbi:hypothetical protein WJX74_010797 [Apatococcus lobatus]|uniref:Uncharacterized protein n=1 Tax=Apatococcus lobatus TaxID=904363 RepID=A0AAW1RFE0_9CHLO
MALNTDEDSESPRHTGYSPQARHQQNGHFRKRSEPSDSPRETRLTDVPLLSQAEPPFSPSHSLREDSFTDRQSLLAGRATLSVEDAKPAKYKHPIPPFERYYMVFIFSLTATLLSADQNLLAPNLSTIADEFHMDAERRDQLLGGAISSGFFAVGAPSALLIGWLSDRMSRRWLLFIVVVLGEGPCLATFWVTRFWELLVVRIATGISLGGTMPLVFSLMADLFHESQRPTVAAGVQLALGLGLAMGQAIAAFAGAKIGWRWPFVIVAVPAILSALIMILTTREPKHGMAEEALAGRYASAKEFSYDERFTWAKLKLLLRTPVNWACITQGLFGSLPWGVLLTYFNDFLHTDKRLSLPHATWVILLWGLGGGIGVMGGGALGQVLYNRSQPAMPIFIGCCTMLGSLPMWWLINVRLDRLPIFLSYLAGFLGGVFSAPPGPNVRALLMAVNEPEARGVALAMQTVLDDVGKGMGPALVAALITAFHSRYTAFNIAIGCWVPCGIVLALASCTITRDAEAMQTRLRNRVALQPIPSSDPQEQFDPETAGIAGLGRMASGPEASRDSWEATDALSVGHLSLNEATAESATPSQATDPPSEPPTATEAPASSQSQSAGSSTSTVSVKPTRKQDPPKPCSLPTEPIDHAVRDALTNTKSRLTVLRYEEQVDSFVRDPHRYQMTFPIDLSGYQRLLAHRTAQYYGLDTSTVQDGEEQGKVLAVKTEQTKIPLVKLADIKTTDSLSTDDRNENTRVLIKKKSLDRTLRLPLPNGDPSRSGNNARSLREREQDYSRMRDRIFGGEGGPSGSNDKAMHRHGGPAPPQFPPQVPTGPVPPGSTFSSPEASHRGGGGGAHGSASRKAVFRNKEQDLQDPDYRRGIDRFGPRFTPSGFDTPAANRGMYQQSSYNNEFPELPAHLGQSPNSNEGIAGHGQPQQQGQYGGMQMGPEGHFMQAGHMGAPGQFGHMPMGPFLMPHGMHQHIHPGMQGMQIYPGSHPMAPFGMPMPPGAYSFMQPRPGQDGMQGMPFGPHGPAFPMYNFSPQMHMGQMGGMPMPMASQMQGMASAPHAPLPSGKPPGSGPQHGLGRRGSGPPPQHSRHLSRASSSSSQSTHTQQPVRPPDGNPPAPRPPNGAPPDAPPQVSKSSPSSSQRQ